MQLTIDWTEQCSVIIMPLHNQNPFSFKCYYNTLTILKNYPFIIKTCDYISFGLESRHSGGPLFQQDLADY